MNPGVSGGRCGPRLTPSVFQESISSMRWSPSGQMLLTCAKEETVKLWAGPDSACGSGWRCLQSIRHPSLVNGAAWCSLPGRGPKLLSMLAMYALTTVFIVYCVVWIPH